MNGEWQKNLENGWIRFIRGGAIISKTMKVFDQTIRIGERSCIIKQGTNFSTKSTMEGDKIYLTTSKGTTISEKCRIGNKQISLETAITSKAEINLPI